ncbi:GEVED domain-containing protein [Epilithonimonas lactis]|nr:GEVED domain-containing protein [Epilithonimonas lactis]SEQ77782.1 hypothetical protein SAMN04488097_2966 [Epilithonimonas lactis]
MNKFKPTFWRAHLMILTAFLLMMSNLAFAQALSCSGTANIPPSGTFTVNGVTITSSYTGDVKTYTLGAYTTCSSDVINSNSLWIGQNLPWSLTLNFDKPINNVVLLLGGTGNTANENFIFNSNGGAVSIYSDSPSSCFSTINGNEILSGNGNGSPNTGGGRFRISAPSSFTSLTINGAGGQNGSVMGFCSSSIVPSCAAGTAGSNQTITSGNAPTALTLTGATGNIQWQMSTDNVTFTNVASGGTSASFSPGALTATRYYRAVVTTSDCTSTSNVVTITVNPPPFDCIGKIYSLNGTGKISAFTDPATSGTLGTIVNTTNYPTNTSNANAMGYSNLTKKFYYIQVQAVGGGNNTFISYDPATDAYQTLAGTTGTIFRGTVTNDGAGYYAITSNNILKYYSITNNTWTNITSNYVDQNGASLNALLNSYAGGDIAMDGNGDLWILGGQGASPTAYVFRVKSTVPTTNIGSTPLVLEQIVKQDIGSSPNGIAFSPTGQLYITNVTTLFRMNGDFTISPIGTASPGGGGDLGSCAFPVSPFAVSDFGDAPDTYKTLLTSDGPRHTASQYDATTNTASLMIGSKIDLETDATPNTNANGDDLSNINDENSISITTLFINSTSYTAVVPVVNTTGGNATLRGWIDFNKNGIFDSSESATVTVPNGATSASLTWTGLSGLTAGDTYYRLRIAKNAADITLPTGSVFGGEVEDGKMTIQGVCYEDPTLVPGETYPVKHGITILGRAGGNTTEWPTMRNSAYTALESKTKGFVITRNSSPETTIAIPVVGMMVFDTDENAGAGCMKIYTGAGAGEGWKCFNTQGCPTITN